MKRSPNFQNRRVAARLNIPPSTPSRGRKRVLATSGERSPCPSPAGSSASESEGGGTPRKKKSRHVTMRIEKHPTADGCCENGQGRPLVVATCCLWCRGGESGGHQASKKKSARDVLAERGYVVHNRYNKEAPWHMCPICGHRCTTSSGLTAHLNSHAGSTMLNWCAHGLTPSSPGGCEGPLAWTCWWMK